MRFGIRSDRGIVREINEDSCNVIAGYTGVPVSFVIADGMGGHNAGEIASKMAVDHVSNSILKISDTIDCGEDICRIIKDIIIKANTFVFTSSKQHADNSGMGTTLIIAMIHHKKLYIGHVGDSRAYLIRDDCMKQLTTDHSYIEELVKSGTLTREEAENHPKKNIITRALGCDKEIQVDTYITEIIDNDVFVLCTDGLTNMLSEQEILDIIKQKDDPEASCVELINAANNRGGEDNTTVIVFKNN